MTTAFVTAPPEFLPRLGEFAEEVLAAGDDQSALAMVRRRALDELALHDPGWKLVACRFLIEQLGRDAAQRARSEMKLVCGDEFVTRGNNGGAVCAAADPD